MQDLILFQYFSGVFLVITLLPVPVDSGAISDSLIKFLRSKEGSQCHITISFEQNRPAELLTFFSGTKLRETPIKFMILRENQKYINKFKRISTVPRIPCNMIVVIAVSSSKITSPMSPFEIFVNQLHAKPHIDLFVVVKSFSFKFITNTVPCNLPLNYLILTTVSHLKKTFKPELEIWALGRNCGEKIPFCFSKLVATFEIFGGTSLRTLIQVSRTNFRNSTVLSAALVKNELLNILARKHNFQLTKDEKGLNHCNYIRNEVPNLLLSKEVVVANTFQVLDKFRSWQIIYSAENPNLGVSQDFLTPFGINIWISLVVTITTVTITFKICNHISIQNALALSIFPFIGKDPVPELKIRNALLSAYFFGTFLVTTCYLCQLRSTWIAPATFVSHKSFQQLLSEGYAIGTWASHKNHMNYLLKYYPIAGASSKIIEMYNSTMSKLNDTPQIRSAEQHRNYYSDNHQAFLRFSYNVPQHLEYFPRLFDKNFYVSQEQFFVMSIVWWFAPPSSDVLYRTFNIMTSAGIVLVYERKLEHNRRFRLHTGLTRTEKISNAVYSMQVNASVKKFPGFVSRRISDTGGNLFIWLWSFVCNTVLAT
ncbi:unnamed protein product [Allacma fusca]|uniref:Uncharacterized protein n=1 Tax=Allacma fusca TaxID=39272 RepID=A0A8J2PV16_9HEXA|nr:unnamed protein product [Allacma fusca]